MGHNPAIRKTPEGKFVLYYIGEKIETTKMMSDCKAGVSLNTGWKGAYSTKTCFINIIESESLNGPWSAPEKIIDLSIIANCATNPAPIINSNGELSFYYRAYDPEKKKKFRRKLYLTKAEGYKGPFVNDTTKIITQRAEDPYVWKMDGTFHLLFNNKFKDKFSTGGHAISKDGLNFSVTNPLYSREVAFTDGTIAKLDRRERPYFFRLDKKRAVLYTAVRQNKETDHTYLIATPVGKWTEKELLLHE